MLTTTQAAEKLGVTPRRVLAMIQAKQLPAQKIGRDYLIQEKDLKAVEGRKPGRPPKQAARKKRDESTKK